MTAIAFYAKALTPIILPIIMTNVAGKFDYLQVLLTGSRPNRSLDCERASIAAVDTEWSLPAMVPTT